MRLRLTPRGSRFFDLLTALAGELVRAADELAQMSAVDDAVREEAAARLQAVEQAADDVSHTIVRDLNSTFVTPFDRDDMYHLTSALDDCVDAMEEAGDRIVRYRVGRLPRGVVEQMSVLQRAAELTADAMPLLRTPSALREFWVEINRLDNEADGAYRGVLSELFEGDPDPVRVLKLREVVEALNRAVSAFENVASAVEAIAVKES